MCNDSFKLWHSRLGHVSDKVVRTFCNKNSIAISNTSNSHCCTICPLSKFRRLSFNSNNNYSQNSVYLVHFDIWGAYKHPTYDKNQFFLTIVDDITRFTWLYLLKQKADAVTHIKNLFAYVKTNFDRSIKKLRFENAKELVLNDFLLSQSTTHQFSCYYRP